MSDFESVDPVTGGCVQHEATLPEAWLIVQLFGLS
jgi:hypothetical protein